MEDRVTYCKGCGRAIRFVRTKRGKWMPCESFAVRCVPDEKGVLLYNEDGTSFRGRIVDSRLEGPAVAVAYEPHFGRCAGPGAAGAGGKKGRADPDAALRLREARERAGEEYKRVLAAELEKRERQWRELRGAAPGG